MTTLEQAKKLDAILTLFKESGSDGVPHEKLTLIYPTVSHSHTTAYLSKKGLLNILGRTPIRMNYSPYQITAEGILHLDAGGFTATVKHQNEMDEYVRLSTKLSADTLRFTKYATFVSISISLTALLISLFK